MCARIGTDPTGNNVVVDTSIEDRRMALLSGVDDGKTTTCRLLARCWTAQEAEHCLVLTPRVHEYADLQRRNVHVLSDLDHDHRLLQSMVNTAVVASYGPAAERTRDAFTDVLALHWNPRQAQPLQGRLDWPGAVDVSLDKRERCDYPQHRWAV